MLPITAAMKAELAKPVADMVHLLSFDFSGGIEHYVTWIHIVADDVLGIQYNPLPVQFSGEITEGSNGESSSVTIVLSGATPGALSSVLTESRWRKCTWKIGAIAPGGFVLVDAPLVIAVRRMMPGDMTVDQGIWTIAINLEPWWATARVRAPRTRSHADQLTIDPDDDCLADAGINFNIDRTNFTVKSGLG